MNKNKKITLIGIVCIFAVIIMFILAIIKQNARFLFILPLELGVFFLKLSYLKEDYSKWKDGKGTVKIIYNGTNNEISNPRIIAEFIDENGKKHKGESQAFKKVKKYKSGDKIEFKYKLIESSSFKNIFNTEPMSRIHIFDDELEEIDSKLINTIIRLLGVFFLVLSIIILMK